MTLTLRSMDFRWKGDSDPMYYLDPAQFCLFAFKTQVALDDPLDRYFLIHPTNNKQRQTTVARGRHASCHTRATHQQWPVHPALFPAVD